MVRPKLLAISSYYKGDRFLQRADELGADVYLLTVESLLGESWPRESLRDLFAQPHKAPLDMTLRIVSYLARQLRFDHIVALDDFDVELAAALREHFRLPGMNLSTARLFRDKLAMRTRARELGVPVPAFTGLFHDDEVRAFTALVPGPWMLKPRAEASAVGIKKIHDAEQLWRALEQLGDKRAEYLLEAYLAGDVCHVDSVVAEGRILLEESHLCGRPPFDVAHGGGVYNVWTVERGSADERAMVAISRQVLQGFGLETSASHVEMIRSHADGTFYFLECGARVGGAHSTEMIEAATGVNPWALWAEVVLDPSREAPPSLRQYGGLLMTLSREQYPDLTGFDADEVFYRAPDPYHAGLVLRSPDSDKLQQLVRDYGARLAREHTAVLPSPEEVAH